MFIAGPMEIVLILIVLVPFILCIVSLVDIVKSEFEGNNKIVWILVVILLPIAGAIMYFTIGKKQKVLL